MSLRTAIKRAEWVLTGETRGGRCPECGEHAVTIHETGWTCLRCHASADLPEPPGWV